MEKISSEQSSRVKVVAGIDIQLCKVESITQKVKRKSVNHLIVVVKPIQRLLKPHSDA